MDLAVSIILAVAGIVYILWQVHVERKGALSFVFVVGVGFFVFAYLIPAIIVKVSDTVGSDAASIIAFFYIFAICAGGFWLLCFAPDKWKAQEAKDVAEIWKEVNALPLPSQETLQAYKAALRIPLYPIDNNVYNGAALDAWRRDEYNKRYKAKHPFSI